MKDGEDFDLCWIDQDETEDFTQEINQDDEFEVVDIRFKRDKKQAKDGKQTNQMLRMYIIHNKMSFIMDIDPMNPILPKYQKSNLYWDKSIFRDSKQKHYERSALEEFLQS